MTLDKPNRRRISGEAILAITVTVIGWIFSTGMMYQKLRDIEAEQQKLEQRMDQLDNWVNAILIDKERSSK